MKKIIIFILAIICLICTGCKVNIIGSDKINGMKYQNTDKYNKGSMLYDDCEINKLYVNWYIGNIEVIENDKIEIIEENNLEAKKKVHSIIEDGTLKVQFWESGLIGDAESKDKCVTIYIPKDIDCEIRNVSGDIKCDNSKSKNFDVSTVSGKIELGDLKCQSFDASSTSGSITLKSIITSEADLTNVSGSISVNTLNSEDATLESTSGRININNAITKEIDLDTVSGRINVSFSECEKANIKSTSASIIVLIKDDFGMTLDFDTTSGELETPLTYQVTNKKNIFGDGKCIVSVRTVSGNLKINKGE